MENFFGCGAKRNDDCFAVLCGDAAAQPINDMSKFICALCFESSRCWMLFHICCCIPIRMTV